MSDRGRGKPALDSLYQEVLQRSPTEQEYNNWIDPDTGRIWGGLWNDRKNILMNSDEYRNRFNMEAPSTEDALGELAKRIDYIQGLDIYKREAEIPPGEYQQLKNLQQKIIDLSNLMIGGKLPVLTTSPEQRERLINQADSTFGLTLNRSLDDSMKYLSQRGLFPEGQTGFSGPAAEVLATQRAKYYENPLTSFIRDFDIQEEANRISRQRQMQDTGLSMLGSALNSQQGLSEYLGNLDLQNLAGKRNFLMGGVGAAQNESQIMNNLSEMLFRRQLDLDRFISDESYRQQSLDLAKKIANDQSSGFDWTKLLGTLGGAGIGFLTAGTGMGTLAGAGIGGSLFNNSGQGVDLSGLIPYAYQTSPNYTNNATGNLGTDNLLDYNYTKYTPENLNFFNNNQDYLYQNPLSGYYSLKDPYSNYKEI